jgi:hypothetical protein
MAHALQQAWARQGGRDEWPCLVPEMDAPLARSMALYLLGPDWRTNVAGDQAVHQMWRERLQAEHRDYVVLYGQPDRQWSQLTQSLKAGAPGMDWSWLPTQQAPGRQARLRPWGCEQCSDPDCERRLFDALRSGRG